MENTIDYLKQFEMKLRCYTNSEATVKNYLSSVSAFFHWCIGKTGTPEDLLTNYIVWRLKDYEPRSINLHRAAIVKFFKIVKGIEITTASVPRKKQKKQLPKIVDHGLIQQAISKTINLKHRLELILFFGCGIRLCEIFNLRRKNVFIEKNILWLQDTKGNKERIVPIPESVRSFLYEYIDKMDSNQLVFDGVCKRTFEKVVQQAFERVGVKASPHVLRHSFATYQIASGQNPFKVQSWLGHGSIKTTMGYIHLSEQLLSQSTDLINGNYTNQKVI